MHFISQPQATKIGFCVELILLAVLTLAFLPGCKRSAANAKGVISKSQGNEEIAYKDETGAEVHYAGGTATVSLPAGFPNDVPLYPKAIPVQTRIKIPTVCVLLNTSDSAAQVKAFYLESLKENGWKTKTSPTTDIMIEGVKDGGDVKEGRKLTVLISEKTGGSQFSLTLSM
jgi:hypothetical protein